MKVQVTAMKLVCDCCGETYEDNNGWTCIVGDVDGSDIEQEALNDDWLELGGKHYCPKCYSIDEDDNYVTKDGCVYDGETEELLKGGEK